MSNVLLTGAAGEIGSVLRKGLGGRVPPMRLTDQKTVDGLESWEGFRLAKLECFEEIADCMSDIDAVIHMGGKAQEGNWDEVMSANIVGTYNVFEAARQQGVKRIVFASSHHVIGYQRRGKMVGVHAPLRPDSRYAVSKIFGEALGRLYADKYGMSVICLRIGSFQNRPLNERMLSTWISPRDTVDLVLAALNAVNIHFQIAYGVSNNSRGWWRDQAQELLGYIPRDNAENYAEEITNSRNDLSDLQSTTSLGTSMSRDAVLRAVRANVSNETESSKQFQGGPLCALEFSGDLDQID